MSVVEFPLPNKWSSPPRWPRWLTAVLLMALTVWLAVLAVLDASGNWFDVAFYLITLVASIAMIVFVIQPSQMYRRRGLESPAITIRDGCLWIEQRRRDLVVQILLLITTAGAGLVFVVGTITNTLAVPISPSFTYTAPVFAISVAVYSVIQLGMLIPRRFSMSTMVLSPDGLRIIFGMRDRSLPWAAITQLTINTPAFGRRRDIDCVVHLKVLEGRGLDVNTNWLSTGCAPTYWLLKYYFAHPEHRDELGDQRAIDRLMSGRVVTRR